jgi:hypothetical protein
MGADCFGRARAFQGLDYEFFFVPLTHDCIFATKAGAEQQGFFFKQFLSLHHREVCKSITFQTSDWSFY